MERIDEQYVERLIQRLEAIRDKDSDTRPGDEEDVEQPIQRLDGIRDEDLDIRRSLSLRGFGLIVAVVGAVAYAAAKRA
jgi:hypothetical protein